MTDYHHILGSIARLDIDRVLLDGIARAMRGATEDADDWLDAYGRTITVHGDQVGTVDMLPWRQAMGADTDGDASAILAEAIAAMASVPISDADEDEDVQSEAAGALALMREAQRIESLLIAAADYVQRGELDSAADALHEAEIAEGDHGDTPSSRAVICALEDAAEDATEDGGAA